MWSKNLATALFLLFVHKSYGLDSRDELKVKDILINILPIDYNSHIRPVGLDSGNGTYPTIIDLSLTKINILGVDNFLGRITFQANLHMSWVDGRLAYNDTSIPYIPSKDFHHHSVWIPDIYFGNDVENPTGKPVEILLIHPNGLVTYSTRLTKTVSCPLAYKDEKELTCSTTIGSYGYSAEDIVVKMDSKALNHVAEMYIPKYSFIGVDSRTCDYSVLNNWSNKEDIYSCVTLDFKLTYDESKLEKAEKAG